MASRQRDAGSNPARVHKLAVTWEFVTSILPGPCVHCALPTTYPDRRTICWIGVKQPDRPASGPASVGKQAVYRPTTPSRRAGALTCV